MFEITFFVIGLILSASVGMLTGITILSELEKLTGIWKNDNGILGGYIGTVLGITVYADIILG